MQKEHFFLGNQIAEPRSFTPSALDIIMRHYTDNAFSYSDPAVRNVKVWKVEI